MTDDGSISEIRRTSIYLSKELLKRLKNVAADREVSVNTILLEAIEAWLGCMDVHDRLIYLARMNRIGVGEFIKWTLEAFVASQDNSVTKSAHKEPLTDANLMAYDEATSQLNATSLPQEFEPWLSFLKHILEQGNAFAAPSIKKNLEAFVRLTDLDGGAHGPPPGESAEDEVARNIAAADAQTDALKKRTGKRNNPPGKRGKVA